MPVVKRHRFEPSPSILAPLFHEWGQDLSFSPALPVMPDAIRFLPARVTSALAFVVSLGFAPAHVWALPANSGSAPVAAHRSGVDGEVQDMVVRGDSVVITYRNTGTQATTIVGELQVRAGDDEDVVASAVLAESVVVKAGETRVFTVAMPALAKGHYTMYAVVDFGGAELTAAQAALEVR